MITKIDNYKIKHQPNAEIFFRSRKPYKRQNKTNYKTKFLINSVSEDEMKKTN
jgi:hypothetical protein